MKHRAVIAGVAILSLLVFYVLKDDKVIQGLLRDYNDNFSFRKQHGDQCAAMELRPSMTSAGHSPLDMEVVATINPKRHGDVTRKSKPITTGEDSYLTVLAESMQAATEHPIPSMGQTGTAHQEPSENEDSALLQPGHEAAAVRADDATDSLPQEVTEGQNQSSQLPANPHPSSLHKDIASYKASHDAFQQQHSVGNETYIMEQVADEQQTAHDEHGNNQEMQGSDVGIGSSSPDPSTAIESVATTTPAATSADQPNASIASAIVSVVSNDSPGTNNMPFEGPVEKQDTAADAACHCPTDVPDDNSDSTADALVVPPASETVEPSAMQSDDPALTPDADVSAVDGSSTPVNPSQPAVAVDPVAPFGSSVEPVVMSKPSAEAADNSCHATILVQAETVHQLPGGRGAATPAVALSQQPAAAHATLGSIGSPPTIASLPRASEGLDYISGPELKAAGMAATTKPAQPVCDTSGHEESCPACSFDANSSNAVVVVAAAVASATVLGLATWWYQKGLTGMVKAQVVGQTCLVKEQLEEQTKNINTLCQQQFNTCKQELSEAYGTKLAAARVELKSQHSAELDSEKASHSIEVQVLAVQNQQLAQQLDTTRKEATAQVEVLKRDMQQEKEQVAQLQAQVQQVLQANTEQSALHQKEFKHLQQQVAARKRVVQQYRAHTARLWLSLKQNVSARLDEIRAMAHTQAALHQQETDALQSLLAQRNQRIAELEAYLDQTMADLQASQDQVVEFQNQLNTLIQALQELDSQLSVKNDQLKQYHGRADELQGRLQSAELDLSTAEQRYGTLEIQLQEEKAKNTELGQQLKGLQETIDQLNVRLEEIPLCKHKLEECGALITDLMDQFKRGEQQLESQAVQIASRDMELVAINRKLEELAAAKQQSEQQLQAQLAAKEQQLQRVMEAKDQEVAARMKDIVSLTEEKAALEEQVKLMRQPRKPIPADGAVLQKISSMSNAMTPQNSFRLR